MARRRMMLVALCAVAVLLIAAATSAVRVSAARQKRLAEPGASLAGCPRYPNCASTEAAGLHRIVPVPFADEPAAALERARAVLLAEPGARLVVERPGYLRVEVRSRLFRFVDDVEIQVDAVARVYRMRSAARLGRRDFGVNRDRLERVGARLGQTVPPQP